MTPHFVLRPRAQRDLEEIWNYSAATWGEFQAETYIRQVQRILEALASDPHLGRSCDEIRAGYRKFPAGSHVVFYKIIGDGVDIVRILHQRMDVENNI